MTGDLGLKSWQWAALGLYAVVLAATVARIMLTWRTLRRTPFLTLDSPRWAGRPPKVSVLVPAKDEAANIAACLESLLDLDYPNFEVLVVDDRSTDDTAAIAGRIAAADPRVRVLRVRELPVGWTGKTHALHFGQRHADGDWLLFVDADATLHPGCLSVALRDAADHDADLESLLPRMEMRSFWERIIQPVAGTMLMVFCPILRANDRRRPEGGFANGQFLLFRRAAYDAIGGHEAVKDKFVEDVNLGRLVKRHRLGLRVAVAPELAAVRMYASLPQTLKGWSRILYAAADASRAKVAALGVVFAVLSGLPYLALPACGVAALAGGGGVFLAAIAACAVAQDLMQTVTFATIYRAGGTPLRLLAWRWLATGAMLVVFWRTFRLCMTHQVTWRGTTYAGTLSQAASAPAAAAWRAA